MTHYAILGGGRLARHMCHYLTLSGLPVSIWSRDGLPETNTCSTPKLRARPRARLEATVQPASHVLLLVSDGAIADLVSRYPFLHQKTLLHCSGALSIPGVVGAHPLMTFGHELYALGQYQKIPFMVDQGHDFSAVLPGLNNPHFAVRLEDKPRYHALCVMAGNFSQILWQAASEGFASMGLPPDTLAPYLQQVVHNFIANPTDKLGAALTGPLSRGDDHTIRRNLNALSGDPLQQVYQSFVELYRDSQSASSLQEVAR